MYVRYTHTRTYINRYILVGLTYTVLFVLLSLLCRLIVVLHLLTVRENRINWKKCCLTTGFSALTGKIVVYLLYINASTQTIYDCFIGLTYWRTAKQFKIEKVVRGHF